MLTFKLIILGFILSGYWFRVIDMVHLSADQVKDILTWPMVNDAVEEAMRSVVKSSVRSPGEPVSDQPARSITSCGSPSKLLFTMPAYVGNYDLSVQSQNGSKAQKKFETLGVKVVTSFRGNDQRKEPLPNILANILLFSSETGQLECVMDATQITAWRTAAASIIATKYLYFRRFPKAPEPSITVAIIGTGVQGESHALGMCDTFKVKTIYLWNRTKSKAQNLKKLLNERYPHIEVVVAETSAQAVEDADVICVGTYAPHSLIDYQMLKKKTIHINTVGAGEVHFGEVGQDIYDNAVVYVDSWESARKELKNLKANIKAEVGEVIKSRNYPPFEGITIFQSMGMAVEDATVAQAVLEAFKNK